VTLESLLKYSSLHLLNDTSAPATGTTQPLNPLRQEVDKLILHLQLAPQPASSSLSALPSPPTAASGATESSASARQLQIFQGKRVVFSGKLSNLTRQQAWDLTEQLGISFPLPLPLL
jgi:NAD-dependent DNA ligase